MANFLDDVGNKMVIELKKEIRDKVDREMPRDDEEFRSMELYNMTNEDLFDVSYTGISRPAPPSTGKR